MNKGFRCLPEREDIKEQIKDAFIASYRVGKKRAEELLSSAEAELNSARADCVWLGGAIEEAHRLARADHGGRFSQYLSDPSWEEFGLQLLPNMVAAADKRARKALLDYEDAEKKASIIKTRAARATGRKYSESFPELWESFGKYTPTMAEVGEKVLSVLPEAVRHTNEPRDEPGISYRGTPFIPLESCWALSQEALKLYWFSVGCNPRRSWECSSMWVTAVQVLSPDHTYDRGTHWGEAFEDVAKRISAAQPKGAADWKRITRGIIRSKGRIYSGRWLRLLGKVSPEMAHAILGSMGRNSNPDLPSNLQVPKMSDLEFWKRVRKLHQKSRQIEHSPGRLTAVGEIQQWLSAGFSRIPRSVELLQEGAPYAKRMFPVWKHLLPFCQQLVKGEMLSEHRLLACLQACEAFGQRAKGWMGEDPSEWHDRGIELPRKFPSPEVENWVYARRQAQPETAMRAARIGTGWQEILKAGYNPADLSLREAEEVLGSMEYSRVQSHSLAREVAKWGLSQEQFESIQEDWLNGLAKLDRETIPDVTAKTTEGYTFSVLDREDPRGLFLGHHTGCCQHPHGAGSTCAWHGAVNPEGRFVVVEHYGEIVAQSWVWRHDDTVVVDSVEAQREIGSKIVEAYCKGLAAMIGQLGIRCTYMGDNPTADPFPTKTVQFSTGAPSGCYTDASRQRLLEVSYAHL